jgi:ABC-2 type transport system permease protein
MSPWRLETLRLMRTGRLIALVATFVILGFAMPVLTYFLPQLIEQSAGNIEIVVPKQTAADGIIGYASNLAQIGTLVVVVVAAASFAIDARPALGAYYRTRLPSIGRLLLPRALMLAAAAGLSLVLGTLGAWYETEILLGTVDVAALAKGTMLMALWFGFVICLTAGVAGIQRSVLGVAGVALGILLVGVFLGGLSVLSSWMPTRLAAGYSESFLPGGGAELWRPVLVAIVTSVASWALGVALLGRREI